MRQVHDKEVDLPLHPADHRQSLAKVRLRVPSVVPQWHKHLPLMLAARQHVILHDGQPADVTVFIAQTLEDPLGCVPLLPGPLAVLFQDLIDDPHKRIQLRSRRRPAAPVSRRGPRTPASSPPSEDRSRTDAPPRAGTDPFDPHRASGPFHTDPPASSPRPRVRRKELPTTEFYSGAASANPAASLQGFVSGAYTSKSLGSIRSLMAPPSVHLRAQVSVLVLTSLSRVLLLPDGDAVGGSPNTCSLIIMNAQAPFDLQAQHFDHGSG